MIRATSHFVTFLAMCAAGIAHAQSPRSTTVGAVAVSLSAKHEITIVLDPSLSSRSLPQGFTPEKDVESSLNLLSARVKEACWKHVQLPKGARKTDVERICAEVRAVAATTVRPFAVDDHSRQRVVLVGTTPSSESESHSAYVIYDRSLPADGLTNSERFAELQREMVDLMSDLPPEQRANPMAAWVKVLQANDKATIENVLMPMSAAGMKMWSQVSPAQRQDMMRDGMQVMSRYGSETPSAPGPRKSGGVTAHNYRPQLVDISGRLGKRFDVQILVEPALSLSTLPRLPGETENIEAALKTLTEPLHGVEWRRVYLPKTGEITRDYINNLAADVRRVESVRESHMKLIARDADPLITIENVPAKDASRQSVSGLSERPVYLLYSHFISSGGDAQMRYENLLTSQMRSLVSMSADELGSAMEQAMQSYQNGEAAKRMDVMGLPVMAAMMATWMPRAAKEQAGGKP